MSKLSVCILFGGMSPEHEVSLRSAESVLNNLDHEKYNVFPVGITKTGDWILYGGKNYSELPSGKWQEHPENRRAAISPIRGQGLLNFESDCVVRERIDVVFPVLHGENGEDGAVQGLLQLAGIPYVGPHIAASAVAMDKTLTKLVVDNANVTQAAWKLVRSSELANRMEQILDAGLFAPNPGGGQSTKIVMLEDPALIERSDRYRTTALLSIFHKTAQGSALGGLIYFFG